MRRILTLGLCMMMMLSIVPIAFAQEIGLPAAPEGVQPPPGLRRATQADKDHYAFQTSDGRTGVWPVQAGLSPIEVLTQILNKFPGANLVIDKPISQELVDFKRANEEAIFEEEIEGLAIALHLGDLSVVETAPGTPLSSVFAVLDDGTQTVDWDGAIQPFGTTEVDGQKVLTYDDNPVIVDIEADTVRLIVVDSDGAVTDEFYQPVEGGAIHVDEDGTREILNSEGVVLGSFSDIEWPAEYEGQQNIVQVAEAMAREGASIEQATVAPNGNFVIATILGDDIIFSPDGSIVTRGTAQKDDAGKPTGLFDMTREFSQNTYQDGQLTSTIVSGGAGESYVTYNFGYDVGDSWSVTSQTADQNGDVGTPTLAETQGGNIVRVNALPGNPLGLGCGAGDAVCVLAESGQTVFTKTGKALTKEEKEKLSADTKKDIAAAEKNRKKQREQTSAWAQAFAETNVFKLMLNILTETFSGYEDFKGIGAWGSLFIGKDDLNERRARMNEKFCDRGLGIDCLAQKVCERKTDQRSGSSVIVTVVPGLAVRAAAHLQAQRTETSTFENATGQQTLYLYHVTYYASSPDDPNTVQLIFNYEGGSYNWFPEPVDIPEGGVSSATGNAAIIRYSHRLYTTVCLQYSKGIDTGTGGSESSICVPIVGSGLSPSGVQAGTAGAPGTTTPAGDPGDGF